MHQRRNRDESEKKSLEFAAGRAASAVSLTKKRSDPQGGHSTGKAAAGGAAGRGSSLGAGGVP